MQNLTVHPGGPSPFLLGPAHARLCSRVPVPVLSPCPLTGWPRLLAAPPRGTVPRPTRQLPLSTALSGRHAHARRTSPVSAALGPLLGAVRRSRPGPMAPPAPRGTPTLRPPPFPSSFPLCCAATEPLAPRSRCSTRPPISTPLRPLLSSARASPLLPAPVPPPPGIGSPLSLADSGRAPLPSATPR
jgi:hypothetical protein